MTLANCVVCGKEFVRRNSTHTICGSTECRKERSRRTHEAWRYSTGRSAPKENLWTEEEREFLINNRFMETKDIAAALGRSSDSVREKRSRMKLPQLSICVKCGAEHKTINQHHTCELCVPNQKEYAENYRNGLNGRWMMYRSNAKRRNLQFNLTIDQFSALWQKPCHYCGASIETIGIDRVDSALGYETNNIVPCCSRCNESKNNLSVNAWIEHMRSVLRHMEG